MNTNIVLAGVGGQGILSIATVIGIAAVNKNLYIKQAEVHGMSQRGGAVYSHLRFSDSPIASDLIPLGKADLILSVEPMEALRYVPYMKPDGWLVTNTQPFVNISKYPDQQALMEQLNVLKNRVLLDADDLATQCGSIKASNMVILGAATPFINFELIEFEKAIVSFFERKGEDIVAVNVRALHVGYEAAMKAKK